MALLACLRDVCPLAELQDVSQAAAADAAAAVGTAGGVTVERCNVGSRQQLQLAQQTPGAALDAAPPSAAPPSAAPPSAAAPSGSGAAPPSATHATPADAAAGGAVAAGHSLLHHHTPSTQGRAAMLSDMLRVAPRLDAAAAEPLLGRAYAVHSDLGVFADGARGAWASDAAPSLLEAVR